MPLPTPKKGKNEAMNAIEKRTYTAEELRVEEKEGGKRIMGYAAVFNVVADGGWFREKVAPGAFTESINQDDVRALWNHDPNFVLGRNSAGTLRMWEDVNGLGIEIYPPDTQAARDLMTSIERGDISQMSFGFNTVKDSWERSDGEKDLRTLEKVKLWDVSPVTFPFYEETHVVVRSHDAWKQTQEFRAAPLKTDILRRKLELKLKARR